VPYGPFLHPHIGMQPYLCLLTEVLQKTEIARIISIGKETGGAIMPSLDDVKGNAGKFQTGAGGAWRCPFVHGWLCWVP
jgi:hypothetical protein